MKFVNFYDLDKDTSYINIGFPPDNEVIMKYDYSRDIRLALNKVDSRLYEMINPDPRIHVFQLSEDNPFYISSISLNLKYFEESHDYGDILLNRTRNASLDNMLSYANFILVSYIASLDFVVEKDESMQEALFRYNQQYSLYLKLVDNELSFTKELKLPNTFGSMDLISETGDVYFRKRYYLDEHAMIFYIVDVEKIFGLTN
ncbi:MAG: hypothetical protein KDC57_02695 [Saprospiraceae bacterium]|nr:hypothetical protein [Saprospiraceae bacterium]